MNNNETTRKRVRFAAIDQYVERNVVLPTEKTSLTRNVVEWGEGNVYPDYLLSLYNSVPTLRTIINGNIDFITGDDITIQSLDGRFGDGVMNRRGDTIREQVRDLAKDFEIYGGFALGINRDHNGDIAEIDYIDMRFLRMNEDCNVFYYCESWGRRSRHETKVYPKFNPNLEWSLLDEEAQQRNAYSILFVKNVHTQTYPAPLYAASILDCETEKAISEFHWNSINHGFVPSMIINFNNGEPTEQQKDEIAEDIEDKFAGQQNGGRFMLCFNKNKDSAVTFETPKVEDFGERYRSLAEDSRRKIFTAFRAMPLLFGLSYEANTGFSTDEFEQSFKLYNRTQIRPVQRKITDAYERIFKQPGVLSIIPFSLEGTDSTVK